MPSRDRPGIDTDAGAALARTLADTGLIAQGPGVTPFGGGVDNTVFAAESPDGTPLIVKVRRRDRRARYDLAAWASRRLARAGIPTPRILWYDRDVSVETRCPGHPLTAVATQPSEPDLATVNEAGALLRRVHAVPVRGFGRLDATGTGTHPSLRAWLLDTPTAWPSTANHGLLALTRRVRQVLQASAEWLPDAPPRLLHGDWTARHVVTENGRVAGLVDLESARGGDPLADVAGWSLQEPPSLTAALLNGYFPHPPCPATRTTLVVHRLRIAVSLLRYHATCGHADQTRTLVRQIQADLDDLSAGEPFLAPRIAPTPPPVRHRPGGSTS